MPKVYLILTDGQNVLVAAGGRSGKPPVERQGYHLPGGKYETRDRSYMGTVIRELREETGFPLRNPVQIGGDITPAGTNGAVFIIVKEASIPGIVEWFNDPENPDRPAVTNPNDEPFTSLASLPLENCWKNHGFNARYLTDYFGLGLEQAVKIIPRD